MSRQVAPPRGHGIPVHPQRGAVPQELRWVTSREVLGPPCGDRTSSGQVTPSLAPLFTDGTLAAVRVEDGALVTRLSADRSWAVDGPRVRTAVHAALTEPWPNLAATDTEPADGDADQRIRQVAEDLLDGPVGELARSHGGRIVLVDVMDGVVQVALDGACHGCPASRSTLLNQLEEPLRAACPELVRVHEVVRVGAVRKLLREPSWLRRPG